MLLFLGLERGDEAVQDVVIAAEHRTTARRAPRKGKGAVAAAKFCKFSGNLQVLHEDVMRERVKVSLLVKNDLGLRRDIVTGPVIT